MRTVFPLVSHSGTFPEIRESLNKAARNGRIDLMFLIQKPCNGDFQLDSLLACFFNISQVIERSLCLKILP